MCFNKHITEHRCMDLTQHYDLKKLFANLYKTTLIGSTDPFRLNPDKS